MKINGKETCDCKYGWGIFNGPWGRGPYQVQRCDTCNVYDSDEEAASANFSRLVTDSGGRPATPVMAYGPITASARKLVAAELREAACDMRIEANRMEQEANRFSRRRRSS